MVERGENIPTTENAAVMELNEEFWRNARILMPQPGKTSVHFRMDTDVLNWFKSQGRGHFPRMNAVLRSFMEAHKANHQNPPHMQ